MRSLTAPASDRLLAAGGQPRIARAGGARVAAWAPPVMPAQAIVDASHEDERWMSPGRWMRWLRAWPALPLSLPAQGGWYG